MHTQTLEERQTYAGNDSTRNPNLTSCKNDIFFFKDFAIELAVIAI